MSSSFTAKKLIGGGNRIVSDNTQKKKPPGTKKPLFSRSPKGEEDNDEEEDVEGLEERDYNENQWNAMRSFKPVPPKISAAGKKPPVDVFPGRFGKASDSKSVKDTMDKDFSEMIKNLMTVMEKTSKSTTDAMEKITKVLAKQEEVISNLVQKTEVAPQKNDNDEIDVGAFVEGWDTGFATDSNSKIYVITNMDKDTLPETIGDVNVNYFSSLQMLLEHEGDNEEEDEGAEEEKTAEDD